MKRKLFIQILQYLFFLGLGLFLFYLAFRSIDLTVLVERLKHARYDLVIISLFFGFLGMIARSYRWQLMIEPLGYKPPLVNIYHALMIGYTANYAFPRIGEITRCGVLSRTNKVPADSLVGTVIAERAWDVVMLLILTFVVIVTKIHFFGHFFKEKIFIPLFEKFGWVFNVSIYLWIIIAILAIAFFTLIIVYREEIKRIALTNKVGQISYGIYSGIKSILKLEKKIQFLLITLIIWVLYLYMTYFALKALKPTSSLGILDAFFLLVVGSYGFAAPVQAGIGAYHGIVALGLSLYTISWSDGLAYALLSHGSQAVSIILLGLISMLIIAVKYKKPKFIDSK